MPVYRDSHCPKRGIGLNHTTDGSSTCVFCGLETYTRDGPGISGAYGMAAFLAHLRGYPQNKEDDPSVDHEPVVVGDYASLTEAQWHRAIIERGRYERGDLSDDWPASIPLTPEHEALLDGMADALIRLFRKVDETP
jgi:hypothetical protein